MPKKKKTKPERKETIKEGNTFMVCREPDSTSFILADRFTIQDEYEGKVVLFFSESDEIVCAAREWKEIRKVDYNEMKKIVDDLSKIFPEKLEQLRKTASPDELPKNWGKVN